MYRSRLPCALLLMMAMILSLIPGASGASGASGPVSWGDFVQVAQREIAAAPAGATVTVNSHTLGPDGQTPIGCVVARTFAGPDYNDAITMRGAAEGVTLRICGLTFEGGMVLTTGAYILDDINTFGVTSSIALEEDHAENATTDITLTLGKNSFIGTPSSPVAGSGIYASFSDESARIAITNLGRIHASTAGINLTANGENVQIALDNRGVISGGTPRGTGFGVSIRTNTIPSEVTLGNTLDMASAVAIRNTGEIVGKQAALALFVNEHTDLTLMGGGLRGTGVYTPRLMANQPFQDVIVSLQLHYADPLDRHALMERLTRILNESGLMTMQEGIVLLSGYRGFCTLETPLAIGP